MEQVLDILLHPLVLPIFFVLLIGAIAYAVSRWSPLLCKALSAAAAGVVVVAGVVILQSKDLTFSRVWADLGGGLQLRVELAQTTLGMVVMLAAAGFALLVAVYSYRSMAGDYWEGKFHAYLIWALGGACIVALAGDLLVLLVGWEIVTLMLFLMVNQGRGDARAGAAKAYGMLGFADACLLMAVALLLAQPGGAENLSLTGGVRSVAELGGMGYLIYALILIAALAKAGAVPLHSWIPAAAENAPAPAMALLPAAVDKLLGIYLLAVVTLRMFTPSWPMQLALMIVGAVTILSAVLMAMMQQRLSRLIAYQTIAQVGYMLVGLGTGTALGVMGGLFHMGNCALYSSLLFLMGGAIRRAGGTDELEQLGGLARALPVTFAAGLVGAAAIAGVPPLNGFASKWLVYQGALGVASPGLGAALLVVAVFGSALTLASVVKAMYAAFLSPAPEGPAKPPAVRESFLLAAPMVVLALACVLLGLWPQLGIEYILRPALAGAPTTGQPVYAAAGGVVTGPIGLWSPTQATGLLFIGIVLGLAFLLVSSFGRNLRVVRPFLAGEVPIPEGAAPVPGRPYRDGLPADRFRIPGTHFYETLARVPIVGPLLKHGQAGALDAYHWAGRHGHTFVEVLRARHTGLISLYVAWVLLGLTATLVYLLLSTG